MADKKVIKLDNEGEDESGNGGLESQYVEVPSDLVAAAQPCPVCQDKFESVWDEEKEKWIWRNSIQVGGKIYHVTCYKELCNPNSSKGRKRKLEE